MNDKHGSEHVREKKIIESRRDFLKKAGRFAVYTPPAVMLLMKPGNATFMKSGGMGYNPNPRVPDRPNPSSPIVKKPAPPDNQSVTPQYSGTLKEYINRTGQFEIKTYKTQQAAMPASQQQPWIEMRKSWWSNFWSRAFGGS